MLTGLYAFQSPTKSVTLIVVFFPELHAACASFVFEYAEYYMRKSSKR